MKRVYIAGMSLVALIGYSVGLALMVSASSYAYSQYDELRDNNTVQSGSACDAGYCG